MTPARTAKDRFSRYAGAGLRHAVLLFILFLIGLYGFLAWQVFSLNKAEPDASAVSSQLKTAGVPHVDQNVVDKIQQLQDNSVDVQTLFDQARQSPFEE